MFCLNHVKATDDDSGVFLLQDDKTTFWSIYCDSDFDRYSKEFTCDVLIWYLEMYHYVQSLSVKGSSSVSGKLPTYPSPKPTFFLKWEISVNVGLGDGLGGRRAVNVGFGEEVGGGAVGNGDSVWRLYHVFLFWKISPPPRTFILSKILNVLWCCLWLFFWDADLLLVWRFWIIILKIIWRKSTIVSILFRGEKRHFSSVSFPTLQRFLLSQ